MRDSQNVADKILRGLAEGFRRLPGIGAVSAALLIGAMPLAASAQGPSQVGQDIDLPEQALELSLKQLSERQAMSRA